MPAFLSTYSDLSPPARLVALAGGVIHPARMTPNAFAGLLVRCRFEHRGHRIRHTVYRASAKEVVAAGILDSGHKGKYAATDLWALWLTVRAHRQGKLDRIMAAYDYINERRFGRNTNPEMRVRCHTVSGRFERIVHDVGDTIPEHWRWLTRPGITHLLSTLPGEYADQAVAACLDEVLRGACPPKEILAACRGSLADPAQHVAKIALINILSGAPEEALGVFERLSRDAAASKPVRTSEAATRAFLATLRGDDAEAVRFIDAALASERAGTRKRNVFPRDPAFTLSLLSLVRDHTPANAAKLERLLEVAEKLNRNAFYLRPVVSAARIAKGHGPPFGHSSDEATVIEILFEGMSICWAGAFGEEDALERFLGHLRLCCAVANSLGLRWVAIECLEICRRWYQATGRDEDGTLDWFEPGSDAGSLSDIVAAFHAKAGTTTLASVVTPVPNWEHMMRGIEQVAHEASKSRPRRKKSGDGRERRLAWVIEEDRYGNTALMPKEQHRLKNGKWSKGRRVALSRLKEKAATMDFLIDQDRAAARSIVHNSSHWHYRPSHYLPITGLCDLAGHPAVYDVSGDRVEVVRRDPELLLDEENGVLRATVEPHTHEATTEAANILWTSESRCEVTRFTRRHRQLCAAIPPDGFELPLDARDRLVRAASALSREIRVQGVIKSDAQVARRVECDSDPWVRLEPLGAGLVLAVLVEPVASSGAWFQPGVGGTTAFAVVDGQAVQTKRDLDAETRAVQELVRACPMLSGLGADFTLSLTSPADCLELVDELGRAGARCLWPKGEPLRVVARADVGALRLSVKSAADWFSASGTLEVDEQRALDLRNLFERIDQGPSSRFVPLGGGDFVSLTASFQRQLADLRAVSRPVGKKQVRLHALAALALKDIFDGAQVTADEGWRERQRLFREAGAFEPSLPGTLQAELRPYQEEGFAWLSRLSRWGAGACLADDMGLGKTVQTLAVLLERATDGPALVVAPTSVVANWLDEARRFAPSLRMRAYRGMAANRARHLEDLGAFDVVVTTYGLLHNDVDALAGVDWSTVVLDEAQAIKNPATKRARAARKLKAGFRLVTTGTPIQNNVFDLYSLFSFLNPGMLGSMKRFREDFAAPIEQNGDGAARTRLRRLIAPFVLRRLKADVLDELPPRTDVTLQVEMSAGEAALYEALRQRAVEDLETLGRQSPPSATAPEGQRMQVLAHLTRLRLACCNPRLVQPEGDPRASPPSAKLEAFATTLDELRQGRHKVLVFSQFVRHLKLVEEYLAKADIPYQYLDGSTPANKRAKRIAAFQAGEGDAFLISLKAGGVGLNLTVADYVIHMDPWWNPAAEDQASDRAHRIGQTRPVTVYRLVTKGTIEEQIVALHRHKRELADRLLEGTGAAAKLSTEELLELLRRPAG